MQKKHLAFLAFGSAVLFILGAGCGTTTSSNSNTASQTNMTANTNVASGQSVTISGMAFSPARLTVAKGTTVTWTNEDSIGHTVTGDHGGPQSGTLDHGGSYSYTFTTAGTFAYHCSIHPDMTGTVIVQ